MRNLLLGYLPISTVIKLLHAFLVANTVFFITGVSKVVSRLYNNYVLWLLGNTHRTTNVFVLLQMLEIVHAL